MLDYNEPDLEEVFMQTFRISYQDVFGTIINYDLKDKGDRIPVTQETKYVMLYQVICFLINHFMFNLSRNLWIYTPTSCLTKP